MLAVEPKASIVTARGRLGLESGSAFQWKDIIGPIKTFLKTVGRRLEEQVGAFEPEIAEYAQYALANQGKQLRPALIALSGRATEPPPEALVTAAVIIEMIHLATLVHDDIMDAAQIRRCRPTVAANWGNELSVLLGDCLFAHALKLATEKMSLDICQSVAAASKAVCSGEILQTLRRHDFEITRAEYFKILSMKTGELFALSSDLGAALSGASPTERAALRQFGLALGTAYQVYDDCLDLFGTEAVVGKSLATDLAHGKLTLPALVVRDRATPSDLSRFKELIRGWDRQSLPALLELLSRYDALSESRQAIHQFIESARDHLRELPESWDSSALLGLTHFFAQQTDALGVVS
jgi:octaprenyl-diphosphate synthase